MIRHIVMFKLKEANKAENISKLKSALDGLQEKIYLVKYLETGVNFNENPRAYDLVLVTDFNSKEDLEQYRVHPEHVKVVELIKEVNYTTTVVDYEK